MKKALSFLLAVVMIVGMIPMSIIPAYAAELPTVEIGTGNELVAFIKNVNNGAYPDGVNAKLTADIDNSMTEGLSCFDGVGYDDGYGYFNLTTPIGRDEDHPFKGTFDGQGHYIEFWFDTDINYFESYGLFGVNYGTIKNLTVGLEGADYFYFWGNNPRLNVGGLCATNYGTIENCVNHANLIADRNAGGICATNYGTVDGCVNYGQVNGYYRAGGIVGTSSGTVINCMNYGHLVADSDEDNTGTGDYANYTGGIVGELDGGKVYNCANYGTIEQSRYGTPAGIVGRSDSGEISACFVGGTVTGKNACAVVGSDKGATITGAYYEIKDGFPTDNHAVGVEKSWIDSGYIVSLLRDASENIERAREWYIGADGYPAFEGNDVPRFLTPSISCAVDENGVLTVNGVGEIPANSFVNDASIKEVVIGENIGKICPNAFVGCSELTAITVNGDIVLDNTFISSCIKFHTINCGGHRIGLTAGTFSAYRESSLISVVKTDGSTARYISDEISTMASGNYRTICVHSVDDERLDVVPATDNERKYYILHCLYCDNTFKEYSPEEDTDDDVKKDDGKAVFEAVAFRPVNFFVPTVLQTGEVTWDGTPYLPSEEEDVHYYNYYELQENGDPIKKIGHAAHPERLELKEDLYEGFYYEDTMSGLMTRRVNIHGNVVLILGNGCSVKFMEGINVPKGSSLTIVREYDIFVEQTDKNMPILKAEGIDRTAGIGSNRGEDAGDISVFDCIVYSDGNHGGAGIGGGSEGTGGTMVFVNSEIHANGDDGGAGIGGGWEGDSGHLYFYGGKTYAESNKQGAGIGGGEKGDCDYIIVDNGAYIEARGGGREESNKHKGGGAGIGGGVCGDLDNGYFYDCTVYAYSHSNAAGIGGGAEGSCLNLNIYDGEIHAIAANGGACGIGAGRDSCEQTGTINIYDGIIYAQGADKSIGGGGDAGAVDRINIYGGTIYAEGNIGVINNTRIFLSIGYERFLSDIFISGGEIHITNTHEFIHGEYAEMSGGTIFLENGTNGDYYLLDKFNRIGGSIVDKPEYSDSFTSYDKNIRLDVRNFNGIPDNERLLFFYTPENEIVPYSLRDVIPDEKGRCYFNLPVGFRESDLNLCTVDENGVYHIYLISNDIKVAPVKQSGGLPKFNVYQPDSDGKQKTFIGTFEDGTLTFNTDVTAQIAGSVVYYGLNRITKKIVFGNDVTSLVSSLSFSDFTVLEEIAFTNASTAVPENIFSSVKKSLECKLTLPSEWNRDDIPDAYGNWRGTVFEHAPIVYLDLNGYGTVSADEIFLNKKGDVLSSLPTPVASGLTFGYWCSDKALTDPYTPGQPIMSDMTLYARWIPRLLFDTMGKSNPVEPLVVPRGEDIRLPVPDHIADSIFFGWYYDKSFNQPYNPAKPVTGDTVLYAKWLPRIKRSNTAWEILDKTLYIRGIGELKGVGEATQPWLGKKKTFTKLAFDQGVTAVGATSFYDLDNITEISFPTSMTYIGEYAFCGCLGLQKLVIPSTVETIESGAFAGCENLVSISLPNSLTYLGSTVFGGCFALKSLTIPGGVKDIGGFLCQGCGGLEELILCEGIRSIGTLAFTSCGALKNVYFPSTLKLSKIQPDAFRVSLGAQKATAHVPASWGLSGTANIGGREFMIAVNNGTEGGNSSAEETPTTPEQNPNQDDPVNPSSPQGTQPENGSPSNTGSTPSDNNSTPSNTASVLSDGNLWIILVVAVLAIGGIAALVIVKKKKKPVTANGAVDSDDE